MANESIIKLFEGNQVRILWNETEEKYYFSVVDIVGVLTDSVNPTDYLKKLRKPIEMRKELTDEWQRSGITEHKDFAILMNVLTQAWSDITTGEYKKFKGLTKENLRDIEDSSAIGQGRTVLFVSHNMASAIQPLCKKRVLLENGMKSYRKAA